MKKFTLYERDEEGQINVASTMFVDFESGAIIVGRAFRSSKDQPNKIVGREISEERAHRMAELVNGDILFPGSEAISCAISLRKFKKKNYCNCYYITDDGVEKLVVGLITTDSEDGKQYLSGRERDVLESYQINKIKNAE